jgi:hypothetical protein
MNEHDQRAQTLRIPPSGIASRAGDFADLHFLSASFNGTGRGVTSASVSGLVARGVKVLSPALTATAVHLLVLLVEHVYDADRWQSGRLTVLPGNRRLALMLGIDERSVRRLLRLLEDNRWLVRRYTNTNRRSGDAGIDLRPLAARLAELHEAVAFLEEEIQAARVEDIDLRDDVPKRNVESAQGDSNDHLESYKLNPSSSNSVQGREGVKPDADPICGADDLELIAAVVQASPTLQANLTPAELMDAIGEDPSPQTIHAVARSVSWIMQSQVRLRHFVWKTALEQHGWAAIAAVCVAVDRRGVKNPAGYLHSMLQASELRRTIWLNLKALADQEAGHA